MILIMNIKEMKILIDIKMKKINKEKMFEAELEKIEI